MGLSLWRVTLNSRDEARQVPDPRRTDYDHEPAYKKIAAAGGRGWDDLTPGVKQDSYVGVDAFLARHPSFAGARALEIGCGGGQVTLRLARAGFRAEGVDYSETAIALARKNATDAHVDATFHVADALDLAPIESRSMDLVIDNHALHCVVDPAHRARFLASVRRVLKPGGTYWCETMSGEGDFAPASVNADPVTGIARNRTRIWARRPQLERELVAAGLTLVRLSRRLADPAGSGDLLELECT
jgi:SAM-dependent methyltransferase